MLVGIEVPETEEKGQIIDMFYVGISMRDRSECVYDVGTWKTGSDGGGAVRSSHETTTYGANLLRKPAVSSAGKEYSEDDESERNDGDGDTWIDWEDQILEDIYCAACWLC
ncbi:hypothetical protein BUALT_Bualt01G0039400 [Buddleja alternifolia]|uniref:Uncharacterized protein n=1 Tax=Buddleja alternifolia TaxID=168488 RepID=A0AAV6YAY2_9LAMI|nr:hypothetical protein BUALT_Bualt01G0039400 [Buddleja alternifolia]